MFIRQLVGTYHNSCCYFFVRLSTCILVPKEFWFDPNESYIFLGLKMSICQLVLVLTSIVAVIFSLD